MIIKFNNTNQLTVKVYQILIIIINLAKTGNNNGYKV